MDSLVSIKNKLEPLSIYDLSNDTLIMAELSTYADELNMVSEKLFELERECFIKTATDYGLSLRERSYTSPRVDLSCEDRREMLFYRLSVTSNDFNKKSIEKALMSSGIRGYVIESTNELKMEVNVLESVDTMATDYEAKLMAEKFLPAHLSYAFDFRPRQWEQIDAEDLTFGEMDAKDLTWDELDGYYT